MKSAMWGRITVAAFHLVICYATDATIRGDAHSFRQQIDAAISGDGLAGPPRGDTSPTDTIMNALQESPHVYTDEKLAHLTESLRLSLLQWARVPSDDAQLRALQNRELIARLQIGLVTFERLADHGLLNDDTSDNSSAVAIYSDAIDNYFKEYPESVRESAKQELQTQWVEVTKNKFTGAGKRELSEGELDALNDEVAAEGTKIARDLTLHLAKVPPDVQEMLPAFYMRQLSDLLTRHLQTTAAVKLPEIQDEKQRARLLQYFESLARVQSEMKDVRDRLKTVLDERLTVGDRRYKAERLLIDVGVGDLNKHLASSVNEIDESPLTNSVPSPKPGTSPPTGARTTPPQTGTSHLIPLSIAAILFIVSSILAVVLVIYWILRRRSYRSIAPGFLAIVALSPVCPGGAPGSPSTNDILLKLAERAKFPADLDTEWQAMIAMSGRLSPVPHCGYAESVLPLIEDALLHDLSEVRDSRARMEAKRPVLSALADTAFVAAALPAVVADRQSKIVSMFQCYSSLFDQISTSSEPPIISRRDRIWQILTDELNRDSYGPLYVHLWSDDLAAKLREEWARYAETVPKLSRARQYARSLVTEPLLEDDDAYADAVIRKMHLSMRIVAVRSTTSESTRLLQARAKSRFNQQQKEVNDK